VYRDKPKITQQIKHITLENQTVNLQKRKLALVSPSLYTRAGFICGRNVYT